jgi:hypothetical protein
MSTGALPQYESFKDDASTKSSERSSAEAVPSVTRLATSDSGTQPNLGGSLWTIPGIDKNTFYAAALYLHTVVEQLEGRSWFRGPKTDLATRDFLDRLADCFARSKLPDKRDHVSATAMVRDEEHKKITLYIAKNRSSKETGPRSIGPQKGLGNDKTQNENKEFAKKMVSWFNDTVNTHADDDEREVTGANGDGSDKDEPDEDQEMFKIICDFNHSRLEHYIEKTSAIDIESLMLALPADRDEACEPGLKYTGAVVNACKKYQGKSQTLISCAVLAGKIRKRGEFRHLAGKVETSAPGSSLKRLTEAIEGVKYLGRLHAAYISFSKFCKSKQQKGYSFDYVLLPSQEDAWTGKSYMEKILSWPGDLGLDEDDIKEMAKAVNEADTAPVHCEMQLMMYFLREGAPRPYDWFGCSKKSCWLCWHMMVQNQKFSMKDTHRKLYPRWALPFDFSKSQPQVAEGLKIACDNMVSLVQAKIIRDTNLGTLAPYPQSSARMTPHHPNEKDGLVQFSGSVINLPDKYNRIPLTTVQALHVPESASFKDTRHVTVGIYQLGETEHKFTLSCLEFNGTRVALAFQLMTYPHNVGKSFSLEEYQARHWDIMPFAIRPPSSIWAVNYLYFRTDETSLAPNICILEAWRAAHGEEYTPENFPWRGDVFIISCTELLNLLHTCQIDSSTIFESLARFFTSEGPYFSTQLRKKLQGDANLYKSAVNTIIRT